MVREIAADAALARMLRGPADWPADLPPDTLLERAEAHGVAALVHHLAETQGRLRQWPHAAAVAFAGVARREAARELARRHELTRMLPLLARAGAPAILLKGCALAHTLYPAAHCRPAVDADILVEPAARAEAFALLRAEGYDAAAFEGGELVNAQASFWKTLASGVPMTFDVHWRIGTSPLFAQVLAYAEVRARARPVAALGPLALAPDAGDALLHACTHRAPLRMPGRMGTADPNRLIWLYDIHRLAGALDAPQWSRFAEQVERHGLRAVCLDALDAASARLGTAVPAEVRARLAVIAREPSRALLLGGRWRLKRAELAALPSWSERTRYLRETLFPAPAYVLAQYATTRRWLLPALYVRRALGWLVRA